MPHHPSTLSPFFIIPPRRNHKQTTTSNGEPATDDKGILQQAEVYDQPPKAYVVLVAAVPQLILLHLQKDCDLELCENKVEQDRLQGSTIVYGDKMQVRAWMSLT